MKLKRLRSAVVLACGGGLVALSVTGCNVGGDKPKPPFDAEQPSSSPTASSSASSTGSSGGNAGGTTGHTTTASNSGTMPTCMAAELRADLQVQNSNSEEKGIGMLILTNRSNHQCLIPAGWAPIGAGGPDYRPLPATRQNYPGRGRTIALRAGNSVFAGMKWHTGPDCGGVTSGLGVAWNSSWIPLTYSGDSGQKPPICDSIVLGTIQPITDGVNFT
ncbi:hypothetical protein [Actinoallomurus rhizosphaericola]|uniref:hypothetical protein n=1 Tax=Actinoallomurus rhizosphaericola TaxID=2952536 RepID=UPI00209265D8|nr:hypothetical protein [Actinoallomurus rhizosphaericola]MCO5994855.1 hypothetical protein [Actinoallomurus rhizosphaericola]